MTAAELVERYNKGERDFMGADLQGTYLEDAHLQYANLQYADLKGASLQYANLRHANLRWADLRGAILDGADLQGAHLQFAKLEGTDLHEANLEGANLQGAHLEGVDLDFSCWPLWCGGLHVKTDRRIMAQLAYHFCAQDCNDPEYVRARNAILDFANTFHLVGQSGIPKLEDMALPVQSDVDSKKE
jgi:uncharacterized protein YjbI with pentapeptide repeats